MISIEIKKKKSFIIFFSILVVTICRRGNDSQRAVDELKKHSQIRDKVNWIKDVTGGLFEWSMKVDNDFPIY